MNKIMNKIGIMQGRVLPKKIDKLQIFPGRWQKELSFIKKIGFDYVELLDDKESFLREILESKKNEIFSQISENKLKCKSVCADHLCNYSLLKNEGLFLEKLEELINQFKEKRNFIFIIPFFDENKLNNKNGLNLALKRLSKYNNFLAKNKLYFSLEIDLEAKLIKYVFKKFEFKNIGICYDLGNNISRGFNLYDEIILLRNHINHIHLKDKKNNKNIRIRKSLGQLNLAFQALKEISFEGLMILETCISPNPLKEAKYNLSTVKEYINKT